jgi:imidazolonepropionase-like amidohydrolase
VEAREIVRRYAESDVDAIKVIYQDNPPGTMLADDVLLAISQEAEQLGLPLIVHAPIASDALRAVELGADRIVHSPVQPVTGAVDIEALGRTFVQSSIPVATTARGQPTRDRNFPLEERIAGIRGLWDVGVTIAFGTDTSRPDPTGDVRLQIEALSRILSPDELLTALTRNAAAYLGLDSEIGTLEAGKRADIVILDADPLADVSALERVRIVIKDGRVVVDNR